jgi:DHA1 family L-arabinose/isopropyl-beta-D-thiogalactopyranoside export protein-like MFS transporter/DHA1 family inner membrane transport protein
VRAVGAVTALSFAAFCFVTTEVLPVGLLTVIADDLHRSRAQTGLLVTGYAIVVVLASVPLTKLTQRVPRRIVLAVTLGVFAAATFVSAVAPNYAVLLGARLVIGLTQAQFWSVVAVTATALFPPEVRGRVVARLSIGNGLAPVLGVPAGTWLGQQAGWRTAFLVMAALNLLTCVAVTVLVPTFSPESSNAYRGSAPDVRRYRMLVIVTATLVIGFFTAYTYITPFLLDVSGFSPGTLGPLLFVSGISGVIGTIAVGAVLDRRPWGSLIVPLSLLAAALLGMYAFGAARPAAIALLGLTGLAFGALPPAIQARTLQVAPGSADMASAGISSAFNVGIATGSFVGGILLSEAGPQSVPLFGGALALVALMVLLADRRRAHRQPG